MRIRHYGFACLAVSLGLNLACDRGRDIEAETRDLAEAQSNTGNVAKDLEARLQEAKAEVVELERQLALAREGITDEVLKEREQVKGALDEQRRQVQQEVNQARQEAEVLNKGTDKAMQQLEQTQPPAKVDTRLKTETDIVRGGQEELEAPTESERIPVRGGPEPQGDPGSGEVESKRSTTRSEPLQPEQPDNQENAPLNGQPAGERNQGAAPGSAP